MTFQAKLTTKIENISTNDTIVELKNNVTKEQLNQIVKNLLQQRDDIDDLDKFSFDFLVGGRFLRLPVDKHLELYSDELNVEELLNEKLVEIEYFVSIDAPEPLEAVPHDDWVSCVDTAGSFIITGSYDNSIRILSLKDRKHLATIQDAHHKPITKVRWLYLPEGSNKNELYFISSGHDEVSILRRLDTKSLKCETVFVYRGHNRSVNCLDCYENLLATGSFDKSLRIWSTSMVEGDDECEENVSSKDEMRGRKKLKIKSSDRAIEATDRTAIITLTGHQESITGVKWLNNSNEFNTVATCSMDRSICFWDIEVGECKRRVLSAKPLLGIDFSCENNLILSASCDRYVRIWDSRAPDNATAKTAYTSHNAWVSSVAFGSNPNNFISGGYDNLVKLWDLRSPKACLYDMIGHHDKVLDVNWTNPAYVLSGSADSTLKVFAT